ncbi:MAG: outer membrane protein assembly factor BamC [Gammaproteobacteria bacterium]|nr:outer membrane protein assembly factor BamC [Gammaproteobacteria bacterium]
MRNTAAVGLIVGLLVIALASGCSSKDRKKIDYDSARTLPPLEIPPGLGTLPPSSSVQSGSATYSEFETKQQRRGKEQFAGLLPTFDNVKLERAGTHKWLVVKAEAEKLWPQMRDFIDSVGLTVAKERPEAGILESDWAQNRVNVGGPIERFFDKIGSAVGGPSFVDKYRIRLERGEVPGTTEVYLSHRGMEQVQLPAGASLSPREADTLLGYKPRPPDLELEAEMLRLLMLHIGVTAPQAVAVLGAGPPPAQATMGRNESGFPALSLFDSQERAWRRVGLSLDRIGFTVEDRDRSRWTYHIRYADPDEDTKKKKKKKKNQKESQEYQVALKPVENGTAIEVFDQNGAPSAAKTSEQILSLLYEQLK